MPTRAYDIGAYVHCEVALDNASIGAGQGGNPGGTNGPTYDRFSQPHDLYLSAKLAAAFKCALTSGNTISAFLETLHSLDDGNTDPYAHFDGGSTSSGNITVMTGLGGAPTLRRTAEVRVNLLGAKRYIKARITPVLSASGVDTASYNGMWVLGGGETLPTKDVSTE